MKKFGRIVVLLLVFVLVFFTACARNVEDDTTAPTPGQQQPVENGGEADTVEPKPLAGRIHEPRDFGGRTLTFGAWWEDAFTEVMWGDEPDPATTMDYAVARMMWDNARRVEEVFNVNFEQVVVTFGDFLPTLQASILSGEPFADVVILEGHHQMEAIGSLIQPLDVANLPGSDILGSQVYAGPATRDENHIWAFNPHTVFAEAFVLGINLDIINAEGLPNPVDLFEAGEWTWDAMLDIMRRATRDTDGDGVDDQFGIAGQPGDIIQHLLGANDGVMVDADLNYGFTHPNSVATLEFAETIFHERLWASEAGGIMEGGHWDRNFHSGKREANAALFTTVVWGLQNAPPAFDFAVVPFPKGPNNTSGNTGLTGTRQAWAVPVGTSWDVADILIVLEELLAWPGDHPELLFLAGPIDWMRENFRTEDDVQRAIYAGTRLATDVGNDVAQYYWVLGMFASAFWNREMDVMQAIEYHRGPQQEMLDQRFR